MILKDGWNTSSEWYVNQVHVLNTLENQSRL
jgi:hypothetical protein